MSTGRSAAERESRQQRRLIAEQRRETQKELAEEKDIQARNERALLQSKKGMGSLLQQQSGLKSLLGAFGSRIGSGGGDIGPNVRTDGAYFMEATDPGQKLNQPAATASAQTDRFSHRVTTKKRRKDRYGREVS